MKTVISFEKVYFECSEDNILALASKFEPEQGIKIKKWGYITNDNKISTTNVDANFIKNELDMREIVNIDGFWYYKDELNNKSKNYYLIKYKTKGDTEWNFHVPQRKFKSKKKCLEYLHKNDENNCTFEVLQKLK